MPGGFVKLYGTQLLGSSLMDESIEARWLFVCFLSAADENGYVRCQTVGNAARMANLTHDQAKAALEALSSPDPRSTTPDHDGRRIIPAPGGWSVVNYAKYREMRTESQAKKAERQARWRANRASTRDAVDARETEVSASLSVVSSLKEGVQGEGLPADIEGEALLRRSRVAKERRFYALIRRLAELQPDKDPTVIAREVTEYTAKDGRRVGGIVRPEQLSDGRLDKSLEDAQWWIDDLEGKGGSKGPAAGERRA